MMSGGKKTKDPNGECDFVLLLFNFCGDQRSYTPILRLAAAPKKPMTAFMLFSNANRAKVKAENPGITFGELVSIVCNKFMSSNGDVLLNALFSFTTGKEDGGALQGTFG